MLPVLCPPPPQKHSKRSSSEELFERLSSGDTTRTDWEQVTGSPKSAFDADVSYVCFPAALLPHKSRSSVLSCSSSPGQAGEIGPTPCETSWAGLRLSQRRHGVGTSTHQGPQGGGAGTLITPRLSYQGQETDSFNSLKKWIPGPTDKKARLNPLGCSFL